MSLREFLTMRRFTGLHMLAIMVLFFGTVIAVNLTMAVMATSTWSGLVAKNGYVASIDYAKDQEAKKAAAALGWSVAVGEEAGHVTFQVSDEGSDPVYMSAVSATAVRALTRDDPHDLAFESVGNGRFRADSALPPGRWVVKASLRKSAETLPWRAVVSVE